MPKSSRYCADMPKSAVGRASIHTSSSPTRVVSVTTSRGRGAGCETIPADWRAVTKGRLDPSTPGISTAVDPDFAIVDPQPGQGGHDVFDHFHAGRAVAERRAAGRILTASHARGDPDDRLQIAPHKHDSSVDRSGTELQADVTSAPEVRIRPRSPDERSYSAFEVAGPQRGSIHACGRWFADARNGFAGVRRSDQSGDARVSGAVAVGRPETCGVTLLDAVQSVQNFAS